MVAVILAIDPGRASGVCVLGDGPPMVCEVGDVLTKKHRLAAMQLIARIPVDAIVVIEDVGYVGKGLHWQTLAGLGKRFGVWWTLVSMHTGRDPVKVHPHTWQSACLGGGRRAGLKRLSMARAAHGLGREVGENAADAWNLAQWAAVEYRGK